MLNSKYSITCCYFLFVAGLFDTYILLTKPALLKIEPLPHDLNYNLSLRPNNCFIFDVSIFY